MKSPSKVELLNEIILRPALWDESAERWSKLIPHDFPGDFAARLKDQVERGQNEVRHITHAGQVVGFVVFCVDKLEDCLPELLVVAMAGRDGSDLSEATLPSLHGLARECGCGTIRFHTMRPGLVGKAKKHGFRVSEIIMRTEVN